MTDPGAGNRSFRLGGFLAVLAGLGGVALLVLAAIRLVDLVSDGADVEASPTTVPAADASVTTVARTLITTTSTAPAFSPSDAATVVDDTGALSIDVPHDWTDRSGWEWSVEGEAVGLTVSAATDLDAWYSTWGTPGVFVGLSTGSHEPGLGDFSQACTRGNQAPYSGGVLVGTVQAWFDCGAEGGDFHEFVGTAGSYSVLIQLVSVDGDGLARLDAIVTSFTHTPTTTGGGS